MAAVLNNSVNANANTPLSATQGGSGVSNPTANGVLIANGSSAFSSQLLTDAQLLIGSTGLAPVAAQLSAGTGISISNGAGSISIASNGLAPDPWTEVTGVSQAMLGQNGYTANNVALVTLSLPATSAVGDWVEVCGKGAGGWSISQGVGQQIIFGIVLSTSGVGGSLSSTLQYDCVKLRALENDGSRWQVISSVGNLSVA